MPEPEAMRISGVEASVGRRNLEGYMEAWSFVPAPRSVDSEGNEVEVSLSPIDVKYDVVRPGMEIGIEVVAGLVVEIVRDMSFGWVMEDEEMEYLRGVRSGIFSKIKERGRFHASEAELEVIFSSRRPKVTWFSRQYAL